MHQPKETPFANFPPAESSGLTTRFADIMALGAQCLDRQMFDEAIQAFTQLVELFPDQAKGYLALGLSLLGAGRLEEALAALHQAASLPGGPHQDEIRDMVGHYFGSIAKARGSVENIHGNSAGRTSLMTSSTKLAFITREGQNDHFVSPIAERFSRVCQVEKIVAKGPQEIDRMLEWADIVWFEWCDEAVVHASQQPRRPKIICRLHRYEAYTDMPGRVRWENVDLLISANSQFVRQALRQRAPDLDKRVRVISLLNAIDMDRFQYKPKERGFKVACMNYLNLRKNPMFMLQCFQALRQKDHRYTLHIAGSFQDEMLAQYTLYMLDRLNLKESVFFEGWQNDSSAWLSDKHFIISTSIGEGHPVGVLEGMALGLKPVIHNFPGAEEFYPRSFLFNTADEFSRMILDDDYQPFQYHMFIKTHHSLNDYIDNLENLFLQLLSSSRKSVMMN